MTEREISLLEITELHNDIRNRFSDVKYGMVLDYLKYLNEEMVNGEDIFVSKMKNAVSEVVRFLNLDKDHMSLVSNEVKVSFKDVDKGIIRLFFTQYEFNFITIVRSEFDSDNKIYFNLKLLTEISTSLSNLFYKLNSRMDEHLLQRSKNLNEIDSNILNSIAELYADTEDIEGGMMNFFKDTVANRYNKAIFKKVKVREGELKENRVRMTAIAEEIESQHHLIRSIRTFEDFINGLMGSKSMDVLYKAINGFLKDPPDKLRMMYVRDNLTGSEDNIFIGGHIRFDHFVNTCARNPVNLKTYIDALGNKYE